MFKPKKSVFHVMIANAVLESIFEECDQFDVDETGGRLIGTYEKKGAQYDIRVMGVLGPGPNAKRSPTSFFQDGEYQEKIFRAIENKHPHIEHLGNWHTHHVNGLQTLSSGDKTTYRKTVDHDKHNTDFFYALLVVRKTPGRDRRYEVKHYFFRQNDETIYEIPNDQVEVVDAPAIWARDAEQTLAFPGPSHRTELQSAANPERPKDAEFFADFYPSLRPLFSKAADTFYWKGSLGLLDGSHIEVLVMENSAENKSPYSITTFGKNESIQGLVAAHKDRTFKSARHAVVYLEREINGALYQSKRKEQ